jgi:DNA-binding CsgD family transcriptional regulator
MTEAGDDPLKDFFLTSEEGSSWEQPIEPDVLDLPVATYDPLNLDQYIADTSLTPREQEVIKSVRVADGDGISMSKVLGQIARDQGKSIHTLKEHYKNALRKLKNAHEKVE